MNIGCVYTVDPYHSVQKPLNMATLIPFGLAMIITVLQKAGHNVELFVVTPETPLDKYIGRYVKDHHPSLFCFTAVSTQYWQVKNVVQYLATLDKNIFCLLGGHHASLNADEVINDGTFDAICIGEGENAVVELADAINNTMPVHNISSIWVRNRETGQVTKNPTNDFDGDLDGLPYINRTIWDKWIELPNEYPSLLLGRGCPFKCTYCSNHAMEKLSGGKYVRFRSPDSIHGEINYILENYPAVERIFLEVETFGANRPASYRIFDALADYNKHLQSPIQFGVNLALTSHFMETNERITELFEKAHAANLAIIHIGLESGSERMRKEILLRPKYTNNELVEFCKVAKQYNVRVIFYVLLGLPGETLEDYNETVKAARNAQPDNCYVAIFFPYLGTDLATMAINLGLVTHEELTPTGATKAERGLALLDLDGFSSRRIRFESIVFWWRVYKGHWPLLKILAKMAGSFLRAYPKLYSLYISTIWLFPSYASSLASRLNQSLPQLDSSPLFGSHKPSADKPLEIYQEKETFPLRKNDI